MDYAILASASDTWDYSLTVLTVTGKLQKDHHIAGNNVCKSLSVMCVLEAVAEVPMSKQQYQHTLWDPSSQHCCSDVLQSPIGCEAPYCKPAAIYMR